MRSLDSPDASWPFIVLGVAFWVAGVVVEVFAVRGLLRLRRTGRLWTTSGPEARAQRRPEVNLVFGRQRSTDRPVDLTVMTDLASHLRALTLLVCGLTLGELGLLSMSLTSHDRTYLFHAAFAALLAIYAVGGWLLTRRAERLSRTS